MCDDRNGRDGGAVFELTPMTGKEFDAGLQAFCAYWSGMRRNGDVPRRSDIDPRGIETMLSNAFVAEKIAPGLARLRIAGSHLSDLMGMEVRGMPVSALIEPAHRETLADCIVELFDRPAKIEIDLAAKGGVGRPALTGKLVLLPLRSDLGDISRALGCLVTQGGIGRGPRRLEIAAHRIDPVEITGLNQDQPLKAEGFSETERQFTGNNPKSLNAERPYLRLVRAE